MTSIGADQVTIEGDQTLTDVLASLSTTLDQHATTLEAHTTALAALESRVTALETRLDTLEAHYGTSDERIDNLSDSDSEQDALLAKLIAWQSERIETIEAAAGCPDGFLKAKTLCIEAETRPPTTWSGAIHACADAGAHVCSPWEYIVACVVAAEEAAPVMTAETTGSKYITTTAEPESCAAVVADAAFDTTSAGYRCCRSLEPSWEPPPEE